MGWPQITWIVLMAVSLLVHANSHGKPRQGNHNFVYAFVATAIHVVLLSIGGFFN